MQTPLEKAIDHLIAPSLEAMGYNIVRVRLMGGEGSKTLQVMAERRDEKPMTLDDCTTLSHTVSALLDVQDPLDSSYRLEVSSPGIDRPLIKEADFVRYAGHEIKLETALPLQGRKRFRGLLKGCADGEVQMEVDGVEYKIPYASVEQAKLVLTEALVKANS